MEDEMERERLHEKLDLSLQAQQHEEEFQPEGRPISLLLASGYRQTKPAPQEVDQPCYAPDAIPQELPQFLTPKLDLVQNVSNDE